MEALPVDHHPRHDSRAAKDAASGPFGLFDLMLNEGSEAAPRETKAADRRDRSDAAADSQAERAADPAAPEGEAAVQAVSQPTQAPAAEGGSSRDPRGAPGPDSGRSFAAGQGAQDTGARSGQADPNKAPAGTGAASDPAARAGDGQRAAVDPLGQGAMAAKVAQASAALAAGGAGSKAQATGSTAAGGSNATGTPNRPPVAGADAAAAVKSPATAALSKDTLLGLAVDPVAGDPGGADPAGSGGLRPGPAATPAVAGPGDFAGLLRGTAADARGGANEQVAVQIRRAVATGNDRISIRLHPAELGRVQVRLEVADDGHVRALITAERPETLDLMQRDLRGLERALQDAGLKTDPGSLSFGLQDQQGEPFQTAEEQPRGRPESAERRTAAEPEPAPGQTLYWSSGEGRLDIRI
ncbi:MAG: flagellar hook-length control protein FliK [Kiloniellales bacterium]|nr:flagellar hook-length control protein FliK [Kiloniellales bacterium]